MQTDIGKRFCKSITIDTLNLNVIDFIDQSIEIDTHNHCCCFKVAILLVIAYIKDLVCNAGVFLEHKQWIITDNPSVKTPNKLQLFKRNENSTILCCCHLGWGSAGGRELNLLLLTHVYAKTGSFILFFHFVCPLAFRGSPVLSSYNVLTVLT